MCNHSFRTTSVHTPLLYPQESSHYTMDLAIWAVLFTVLIVLFSIILQYWTRPRPKQTPVLQTQKLCFGRNFKLGMLYSVCSEKPLAKMLWSKEFIKIVTTTHEKDTFKIIRNDDFLSEKLQHLGVDNNLGLYIASGLVETSKLSFEYLQDSWTSSRQARVVLHYSYTTKHKEIDMTKKIAPKVLQVNSSTHVIVGIEYGLEVFFVFEKFVPESEYNETCRQMKSLIEKVPELVKWNKKLSKEESLLASQLKVTLYSDIPFLEASTFDHVINICSKILPVLATLYGMDIPKKAWLYPLHHIDSIVHDIQCCKEVFKLFEQLRVANLEIYNLMEQDVCNFFTGINEQLKYIRVSVIEKKQQELKKILQHFLPQIRCKQCAETELQVAIAPIHNFISSIKQWLKAKKKEIDQISAYWEKLFHLPGMIICSVFQCFHSHTGIRFLLSKEEFDLFMEKRGATNYIISLELEIDQEQVFDPEEISKRQVNKGDAMIENFVAFVKEYREAKCVITISHSSTASQRGAITYLYVPGQSDPIEFEFPKLVRKPKIICASHVSVKLKFPLLPQAPLQIYNPIAYNVLFRTGEDAWQEEVFKRSQIEVEIGGLQARSKYEFKVAAKYVYGLGADPESESVVTDSLANQIIKDGALLGDKIWENQLSVYMLKTKLVMRNDEKLIAKEEFGQPQPSKQTKVVILMGETGTGKSTLINGIINYVLGVKCEDTFRFKLICNDETKQTKSVTNIITAYTVYWQEGFTIPYNLTIIDTPGFCDTDGLENDKKIPAQVKDFLDDGDKDIHAIGFVVKSDSIRLTAPQKYVHKSILEMFSKDIKDKIFIMATFNDNANPNTTPEVMGALNENSIPYKECFSFNYSVTYNDPAQGLTKVFWDMNYLSTFNFFKFLHLTEASALQLSRDVLIERERLESILNGIYPKMQDALSKIDTLQKEETLLNKKQSEIIASKDYSYKVKVTKQRKVNLKDGTFVTNCLVCNVTCHYPCRITKDGQKYKCTAMDKGGKDNAKCNICPKKCPWGKHINNQYYFKSYTEEETRTSEELLKRYKVAKDDKDAVERVIEGLHDDLADLSKSVYCDIREVRRCIGTLNEKALKPHNSMTEVQYIDLLIESENQEKKPGFGDRITSYKKMKKKAQLLSKLTDEQIDEKFEQPNKEEWWQFWFD